MTELVSKAAEVIKVPLLLKEFVRLMSGVAFLFFLYVVGFNMPDRIEQLNLAAFELSIVFLIIAYVIARLLLVLAHFLGDILCLLGEMTRTFLNDVAIKQQWQRFAANMKIRFSRNRMLVRFLTGTEHIEPVSTKSMEDQLALVDLARIMDKFPSIASRAERDLLALDFINILIGASLVSAYLLSAKYLLLTLFLLLAKEKLDKRMEHTNQGLYLSAVKYNNRHSEM